MSEVKTNKITSLASNNDITLDPDGTGDVIVASGNVGIGETSPSRNLVIKDTDGQVDIGLVSSNTGVSALMFADTDDSNIGRIQYLHSTNDLTFTTNDSEAMRIDSSGNVGIGTTTLSSEFTLAGRADITNAGLTQILDRTGSDGDIVRFEKDGSEVGSIGVNSGDNLFVTTASAGLKIANTEVAIIPANGDGTNSDNDTDIGLSGARFDDIFATNGTIQTSDQNEKQDIASLTTAEITAAKAISKLFKTFKWKDKVAAKGDAARTHTGVIAQEVQTAMSGAGLNAANYAFWCSDTWWEANETYTDDDGVEQTRINTYDIADEAPEGATQRTRLGVRYPELLAFIGAATEQRLADLETRVTALEDA